MRLTPTRALALTLAPAVALVVAALAGATGPRTSAPAPALVAHTASTDPQLVALLPDSWPCGVSTCLDPASWEPVPQDWADALAEGEAPDASTRDWSVCWLSVGDTSYVLCPDGTLESS